MSSGRYIVWFPTVIAGLLVVTLAEQVISVSQTAVRCLYVEFAGPPQFVVLDEQSVRYALNTPSTVLQIGSAYYLFRDGVWFKATSALGPYSLPKGPPAELATVQSP